MTHRTRVEEQIAAARHLSDSIARVAGVARNVAVKARPRLIPADFEALVEHPFPAGDPAFSALLRPRGQHSLSVDDVRRTVRIRFAAGRSFEFPWELLSASDREVATWARSEIARRRRDTFHRELSRLTDDIAHGERVLQRAQRDLDDARSARERLHGEYARA